MFKRLSSHIIISCAVFCLVATYFIWVIDATFLNSKALNKSLSQAGVPSAIASAIPEKITQNVDSPVAGLALKAEVTNIVTPEYIERKLNETTSALIKYVREGKPEPSIKMNDFPGQITIADIKISGEQAAEFDKPILLNESGALNKVPEYYKRLELIKFFGILVFFIFIGIEWLITEKGNKLRRIGRIFLHAGIWFMFFWLAVVFIPSRLLNQMAKDPNAASLQQVGATTVDAMQLLLTPHLLGAAIVCLLIAIIVYLLRHGGRHLKTIEEVPTARIRSNAMAKLPTRQ